MRVGVFNDDRRCTLNEKKPIVMNKSFEGNFPMEKKNGTNFAKWSLCIIFERKNRF